MNTSFVSDADVPVGRHPAGCACALHRRRRLALGLAALGTATALPAWAQREGVDVGKNSGFTKLVPADQVEKAAAPQQL